MCFFVPLPGVIYQVLHYLIGLRNLGYDAYYLEESDRWPYSYQMQTTTPNATGNVAIASATFAEHGFEERWAFNADYDGGGSYGIAPARVQRVYETADALLNITGQELRPTQLTCKRRIYIETDPFATQVRASQRDADVLARLDAHDTHFTFGENMGAPDCHVPQCGIEWRPTRQPVAMDVWTYACDSRPDNDAYTTITTWSNQVGAIEYEGETYHWQKNLEFEKVLDLPRSANVPFEIAANVNQDVHTLLRKHGWRHVSSEPLSADTRVYREYIQHSRAEFTVARDQYVRPRTGWFSDRSACYLAAGRPVITQETGFSKFLPTGRGLFAFTTLADIVEAVDTVESNYPAHRAAAAEIAAEFFAAEKVVGSLMERSGL